MLSDITISFLEPGAYNIAYTYDTERLFLPNFDF